MDDSGVLEEKRNNSNNKTPEKGRRRAICQTADEKSTAEPE